MAATHPPARGLLRDMKRVPPAPALVRLRHGDRVRLQVTADRPGFVTVFNVGGNKYRLIAAIHYNRQRLYVLRILTHAEYDKDRWKDIL